jgi:RHS repeat-associated protein
VFFDRSNYNAGLGVYYPFGMVMPGRSYSTQTGYRYGFNGKENDTEYGSGGLTQDYGFRMYNPAIAKFLSVDPLAPEYPWYTPYQFAGNMPIWAIDLDGLEPMPITSIEFRSKKELDEKKSRLREAYRGAQYWADFYEVHFVEWGQKDMIIAASVLLTEKIRDRTLAAGQVGGLAQEKVEEFIIEQGDQIYEHPEIDTEYFMNATLDQIDSQYLVDMFCALKNIYEKEFNELNSERQQMFASLYDKGVLTQIATNIRKSNIAIFGPMYDQENVNNTANKMNITYFDLSHQWHSLSEEERYTSIRIFIDTQIELGGSFIMSEGFCDGNEDGYYNFAIEMIKARGYKWTSDTTLAKDNGK